MPTIVVVDDSAIVLAQLRLVLEQEGYTVVTVDTPFGASAAIARNNPDLVLVDVTMPALTGDVIVSIARRRTMTGGAKILLMSDRDTGELAAIAGACGADGFIPKTSDWALFVRQLNSYLAAPKS